MKTATITRTFSLIPTSPHRKQMYKKFHRYLVKFRDLENLFVETLIYGLKKEKLTIEAFSGTSTAHIKQKVYNHLALNKIKAPQFQSIHFKERVSRCAIVYPYHAVRNWLIRNENLRIILSELINLFGSDQTHLVWFLGGRSPPNRVLNNLFFNVRNDVFGNAQYLTSFHITNMIRQLRNIFLSSTDLNHLLITRLQTIERDKSLIEQFLTTCLSSFYRKKSENRNFLLPKNYLPISWKDIFKRLNGSQAE